MIALVTLEINNYGIILSVTAPGDSPLYAIFPPVGNNLFQYLDNTDNSNSNDFIDKIFSSSHSVEFLFSIKKHFIQCTAHRFDAEKAFLHCKLVDVQPQPKGPPPPIDDWGFKKGFNYDDAQESCTNNTDPRLFFKDIIDNVPIGIIVYDFFQDGSYYISYVNREIALMVPEFDKDAQNEDNSRLMEFTHPEDKEILREAVKGLFELKTIDVDYRVLVGEKTKSIRFHARPIYNKATKTITVYAYFQEISDRKATEEQLKLVEHSFKTAAFPMYFVKSNGLIHDFNTSIHEILGYTKEEFKKLSLFDISTRHTPESWHKRVEELKKGTSTPHYTKVKKKDGSLIDVEMRTNLFEYKNQFFATSSFIDVTEKNKILTQLKLVDFIFKKVSMPIILGLQDGTFLDFNLAALELYGYTAEEMSLLHTDDLRIESNRRSYTELWAEVKAMKKIEFESVHKKKDGRLMAVEVIANYCKYGDTEVSCTFIKDITEKKKAEESLKRSNERYEYATNATSDVIWEHDLETNMLYYSKNFANVFGHKLDGEWIVQGDFNNVWWRNLHPDDFERAVEFEKQVLESDGEKWESEYRLRKANGNYALVLDRGFAMKDENGKVIRWIGAMQDITEKRRTEDELKKSVERYEYATKATWDVVWEADLGANTYFLSNNFATLFGHEPTFAESANNNRWLKNVHPDDLAGVLANTQEILKGEKTNWVSEYRLKKADGEYAIIHDKCFGIRNEDGKVIRLVGAMQDMTLTKLAEKEKEALLDELVQINQELKQFSYITTHNLRAPLTNLVSICKMIDLSKIEDPKTMKLIDSFKASTMHLNETLNDLMKVLIIKENKNIPMSQLNLEEVFNKIKASIHLELINKGAIVETDFANAPFVHFSSTYLDSILLNLLTNAIKYAHPERQLSIKIKSTKELDGRVKLTFSDNGVGMDMQRVKDKIFGLYQRFHSNSDSKGIGLYLIHSQITSLGGTIEVESQVNVGTTFIITFK